MLWALAIYWTVYCFLHSFFADDGAKERARSVLGNRFRYYRIGYNIFSGVLLLPAWVMEKAINEPVIFEFGGWFLALKFSLLGTGAILFFAGSKAYDMKEFLGISQLADGEKTDEDFQDTGILSVVRHPWYLGGLLILWSRDLTPGTITTNALLTAYLFIGAVLEERKLKKKFGRKYEEYARNVPMFIPKPSALIALLSREPKRPPNR